jgi:hypothetical protein
MVGVYERLPASLPAKQTNRCTACLPADTPGVSRVVLDGFSEVGFLLRVGVIHVRRLID